MAWNPPGCVTTERFGMCYMRKAFVTCYNKKLGICGRNGHRDMLICTVLYCTVQYILTYPYGHVYINMYMYILIGSLVRYKEMAIGMYNKNQARQ
jgi:hypothetical protein